MKTRLQFSVRHGFSGLLYSTLIAFFIGILILALGALALAFSGYQITEQILSGMTAGLLIMIPASVFLGFLHISINKLLVCAGLEASESGLCIIKSTRRLEFAWDNVKSLEFRFGRLIIETQQFGELRLAGFNGCDLLRVANYWRERNSKNNGNE